MKSVDKVEKNRKNKVRACKAKITEMENKLKKFLSQESGELFSLEDHPDVLKFKAKLEAKKIELQKYQEYDIESFVKNNHYNKKP